MKKHSIFLATIVLISLIPFHKSFADTAQVMPKGHHRVELQNIRLKLAVFSQEVAQCRQ